MAENCGCGYPRKMGATCGCGKRYPECSRTGSDGSVCDNPYHSQDIPFKGEKWWDDDEDWYWGG